MNILSNKGKFIYCLYIGLSTLLITCKDKFKKNISTTSRSDTIQTKNVVKIIWPDSLIVYNPFNLSLNANKNEAKELNKDDNKSE